MNSNLSSLDSSTTSSNLHKTNNDDYDHDPICKFQHPSDPTLVIIFFHDILWPGGEQQLHKSTWMSTSTPPVCWPEDWLHTKYKRAQILSVHYDAAIRKSTNAGHMNMFLLSENLWQDILPISAKDVPVFLVGHGFGGLVIKALILKMREIRNDLQEEKDALDSRNDEVLSRLKSFLENVKGILYYSTPFLGSKLADSITNPPATSSLLDNATVQNTDICRINDSFSRWRMSHRGCRTKLLLEGSPSEVGYWHGHLVEEASARFDVDNLYTVYGSNHFDVCKPRSVTDIRFKGLADLIDSVKSPVIPVSRLPMEDISKSACAESLKNIFKKIQQLKERRNKEVLLLRIDVLVKIREFEDLKSSLQGSLDEAGFRKTCVGSYFEHYE